MRILHVAPTLNCTGLTRQMVDVANGLPRAEFESQVIALSGGVLQNSLRQAGIALVEINHRRWVDIAAWQRLRKTIRAFHPEVVTLWGEAASSFALSACVAEGCRSIITVTGGFWGTQSWPEKWSHWLFSKRIARWVVPSRTARQDGLARGLTSAKLTVISPGVTIPVSDDAKRGDVCRRFDIPEDAHMIGAVGRLICRKRLKDVIWAADMLKFYRPDVYLLIIGEGPHRWRLERFCGQCRIEDRVRFLGERDDLSAFLPHLDCLWETAGPAGTSRAVLEAMAAGVSVVASDIPAHREILEQQRTGWLVGLGDRAGFANAANRLIEDRELAGRLGAAGQARVAAEFSSEQMLGRYAELYRESN